MKLIAGAIIGLLVLILILLHTAPVQSRVLEAVQDYLRTKYDIELQAEKFGYNLLTLTLELTGVSLRAAHNKAAPPFLKMDAAYLDLSLPHVWSGEYTIDEARLVHPQINVILAEGDQGNLPHIPAPPKEKAETTAKVLLTSGTVGRASFRLEDRTNQLVVELPDWSIGVMGNGGDFTHAMHLQADRPGTLTWQGESVPIHRLEVDSQWEPGSMILDKLLLNAGQAQVTARGKWPGFEALDMNATVDVALAEAARLAKLSEPVEGQLHSEVTLKGPLDKLEIAGAVRASEVAVRGLRDLALDGKAAWADGRLKLNAVEISSPMGSITANGDLAVAEGKGESRLQARINRLRLQPVSSELKLPVMVASTLSGTVNATLNQLNWKTTAGAANLRLEPSGAVAPDTLPLAGSLELEGRNQDFIVRIRNLTALGSTLDGSVSVTGFERLGGELKASASNLEQLSAQLNTFLKSDAAPPLGGSLSLTANLGGTVKSPTAAVQLATSDLRVRDLEGIAVEAAAGYSTDRVEIQKLRAGWQGQSLTAAGTVGLKGESPTLNVDAQAQQVSIADLLRGLGNDTPASGTFDLQAQIRGTTKAPQAHASLRTGPLVAYGEAFNGLVIETQLANRQLAITRLELTKESGQLVATGEYGLDSRSYQVNAKAQELQLTGLTLPGQPPLKGTVNLSATGSGSVDNPNLEAQLNVTGVRFGERNLGDVTADAQVANQQAVVKLNAPGFALASNAQIGTKAPYPVEFQLQANGTDLAQLRIDLGEGRPLTGKITAEAHGSGTLSEWENGTASVEVSDLQLEVEGQQIRNEGPIQLGFDKGVLDVRAAQLITGESRISATGSLPLNDGGQSNMIQAKGELSLPALVAFAPQLAGVQADGTLRLSAQVRGSLRKPVPTATIQTEGASIQHPSLIDPLEAIQLDATYQDDRVELRQLTAQLGDGTIKAQGVIPLKEGEAKLEADVANLELASFTQAPEGITSKISFHAEAQSPRIQDLAAARANVTFQQLSIAFKDLQLDQQAPTNISVEGGVARIRTLRLSGPDSSIEASGTLGLQNPQNLDVAAKGKLDAAVLTLFSEDVQAEGQSSFELAVRGTAKAPELAGFFELKDAQLGITSPEIIAEDLNLRLELATNRITIGSLTGILNGGDLKGSGFAEYSSKGIGRIDINISAKDAFFNIPAGLKTQVQADLRVRNVEDNIEIGGKVQVAEGAYREPLDPDTQIFQALRSAGADLTEERNPALEKIRFNIEVNTTDPVLVQNNLMQLALTTNVRVVGTYYRPGLLGKVSIDEGGEMYLNERRYFIERGELSFVNPREIKPDVDIQATTRVSGYDITLHLSGGADKYAATFTSDPALSQPDIISVLLTGRKLEQVSGQETNIARDQALSFLTGAAASRISSGAQKALGLSEVRIEPNLISPESDPGARLTVAQSLTDFLKFVYSMNLRDSNDQIQILEWDVTRRFLARSTRQADNTYRFDFNHDLSFGGPPDPEAQRKREKRKIGQVHFEGNTAFPEKTLADKLDMKPGSEYSFFKVHKKLDGLRDFYTDKGYLETRVRTSRNIHDRTADLTVTVREGQKVQFVFEGYDVSGGTRKDIRKVWRQGFVDVQRLRESTDAIRNELDRENFLQPEIRHEVRVVSGVKRVLFEIQPGLRFHDVKLVFEGAKGVEADDLRALLDKAHLLERIHTDPTAVSGFLNKYYRQEGFLNAKVNPPRFDLDQKTRTGRIAVDIVEGPQFRLGELKFNGNNNLSSLRLENVLPIAQGDEYNLKRLRDSLSAIEEAYWQRGYNAAEVVYKLDRHEQQGTVDVVYQIDEKQQEVVKEINVAGNDQTSEGMIRTQLVVSNDEVLDYRKTNESRRKLYETGAYALVDIEKRSLDGTATDGLQAPVALDVKVREVKPHNLLYGASYDTERGPGIIVDYQNHNSLGAARTLGFRARYDSEFRELRTYFGQPLLRRFPVKTTFAGFGSRQIQEFFITDRVGFSLQQETRPWERTLISYGYRFERTHTFDKDPDSIFQLRPFNVAPLTFSYSRDTRDEMLDATHGSMFSHAFDYAPSSLGSDIRFIRYFGQYFHYVPLAKPVEVPFAHGRERTRLVYAGGVRVGLGKGLGDQDLVRTERFFAGGSTTLRGFERDEVGPRDGVGPTGGNAVFLTNNEIRFPLVGIFDGVGFLDIGNVYRTVSDFDPANIRKSAGVGLRVRTPYFLLRVDYGFVLDKKPNEPRSGFYFSIGQAF